VKSNLIFNFYGWMAYHLPKAVVGWCMFRAWQHCDREDLNKYMVGDVQGSKLMMSDVYSNWLWQDPDGK
jgi:hypothetical protein